MRQLKSWTHILLCLKLGSMIKQELHEIGLSGLSGTKERRAIVLRRAAWVTPHCSVGQWHVRAAPLPGRTFPMCQPRESRMLIRFRGRWTAKRSAATHIVSGLHISPMLKQQLDHFRVPEGG